MDLSQQHKYRKVLIPCRQCGRMVRNKRTGREREFCSEACKQQHHRTSKFETRYGRAQPQAPLRNPEISPTNSVVSKGENRIRAACLGCGRSLDAERVKLGGRARFCHGRCVDAFDAGWPVYGGA